MGGMNTHFSSPQNPDTGPADQYCSRSAHKNYDSELYRKDEGSVGYLQLPDQFTGRFGYSRDRTGQESVCQVPTQVLTPDPDILEPASINMFGVGIQVPVKLVPSRPAKLTWWHTNGPYNLSRMYNQELTPTMCLQGQYVFTSIRYGYPIDLASHQFSPSIYPFAAPASGYRRKRKLLCQPAVGKKSNVGFDLPWRAESVFLMRPRGDLHRMVGNVRWEGGRGIALVPVQKKSAMV